MGGNGERGKGMGRPSGGVLPEMFPRRPKGMMETGIDMTLFNLKMSKNKLAIPLDCLVSCRALAVA